MGYGMAERLCCGYYCFFRDYLICIALLRIFCLNYD